MILQGCLCYYSSHQWGLDPSYLEMFGFFIYVHLYHVYLNISNLLEVNSMHKHCPNHFCIIGFEMSIVVLIEKSCELCFKTIFNPNSYFHRSKMMFSTYSNGNESHVQISYYIVLFDFWVWVWLLLDFFMKFSFFL